LHCSTTSWSSNSATGVLNATADSDSKDDTLSLACTSDGKEEFVEPLLSKAADIKNRERRSG